MKALIGAFASVALVGAASAQVSNFAVATTNDGTQVSNVLSIDFAGQYTGSQLLVELTSGSILNVPFFGGNVDVAPTSGQLGAEPNLAFDTYLAQGGIFADSAGAAGSPNLGGGAVNIVPSEASAVFNNATKISQGWNPAGGNNISDRSNFVVAQLAFSPDANGTFTYFASAGGEFFFSPVELGVVNGVVTEIPEPASLALLGLGGLAMLRRRSA